MLLHYLFIKVWHVGLSYLILTCGDPSELLLKVTTQKKSIYTPIPKVIKEENYISFVCLYHYSHVCTHYSHCMLDCH